MGKGAKKAPGVATWGVIHQRRRVEETDFSLVLPVLRRNYF